MQLKYQSAALLRHVSSPNTQASLGFFNLKTIAM